MFATVQGRLFRPIDRPCHSLRVNIDAFGVSCCPDFILISCFLWLQMSEEDFLRLVRVGETQTEGGSLPWERNQKVCVKISKIYLDISCVFWQTVKILYSYSQIIELESRSYIFCEGMCIILRKQHLELQVLIFLLHLTLSSCL